MNVSIEPALVVMSSVSSIIGLPPFAHRLVLRRWSRVDMVNGSLVNIGDGERGAIA